MSQIQWAIRNVEPSDIAFIYSSWLKSYKFGSDSFKSVRSSIFFTEYREIIDDLLHNCDVFVACLPEDISIILGYIVFNSNTLHYCFVKESFRNLGIATDLYNKTINTNKAIEYTHETKLSKQILNNNEKFSSFNYNPFLLYRKNNG